MKYEQTIEIPSKREIVEHELAPCLKCGSESLKPSEYEDHYGFISTVTCLKCKNESKVNGGELASAIHKWNHENDIVLIIADKHVLINKLKEEIKELTKTAKGN